MKNTLKNTAEKEISPEEVKTSVAYAANKHNMSFDRKEYIANFIQDGIFYGMSKDAIRGYTENLKCNTTL